MAEGKEVRDVTKVTKEFMDKTNHQYVYAALSAENIPKEQYELINNSFLVFWEDVQKHIHAI